MANPEQVVRAWRSAHDTLTLGPALSLAIAAVFSSLSVDASINSTLAWFNGVMVCDGPDPEGDVVQFREAAGQG